MRESMLERIIALAALAVMLLLFRPLSCGGQSRQERLAGREEKTPGERARALPQKRMLYRTSRRKSLA